MVVRLGDYDLTKDDDGAIHKDYSIEGRLIHKSYAPPATYHDIALIKLNETVIFTDFIKPVCLWTDPSNILEDKKKKVAIGWGNTEYGMMFTKREHNFILIIIILAAAKGSDVLLKVGLLVYSNSICNTHFSDIREREYFPNGVASSTICAGDLESEKDTCQVRFSF